jgi:TetR/AcrR family transcriptional regulator, cholesterol catabolism regulator
MIIRSSNGHSAIIGAVATRPTRPALRERYDRRRRDVVEDAARVFARRGYDQTSMQQLAEDLGIAAGGLYHYFGGKEHLLIAICDQLMHPLLDDVRALADDGLAAGDHLRALVRLWVAHVVEHRDHMLVFQQERHVIDRGEQWKGVRTDRKHFERLVEEALRRVEADALAHYDDRRLALSALLGMVNHTAQWYRPSGRLTPQAIADGYTALLLRPTPG